MKRPTVTFLVALTGIAATTAAMLAAHTSPHPLPIPAYAHWPFPMAVSPNGRYLATVGFRSDAVQLYDFKTGKTHILTSSGVNQFYQYRMDTHALVFSPDSKTLANGGAELGSYNAINTWDTATGTHKNTFALLTVGSSVLYTPDGKSIVAAAKDNAVHLYNARTGQSVKTLHGPGGPIVSLALSPDGQRVAIGTIVPTCSLQVRDLRSGHALWTIPIPRPEAEAPSLAFSPDGRTLARGGQYNTIYLHDASTGRLRVTLSDPIPKALQNMSGSDAARTIAYSPDGRSLAGAGIYRIIVWSTRTGKVVLRPAHAGEPFAFMPGSRTLAATLSDIPAPHPAGVRAFLMRPPRRSGNISLWSLR